jgi:hypothetical protein
VITQRTFFLTDTGLIIVAIQQQTENINLADRKLQKSMLRILWCELFWTRRSGRDKNRV